jgi:hypothetical protein
MVLCTCSVKILMYMFGSEARRICISNHESTNANDRSNDLAHNTQHERAPVRCMTLAPDAPLAAKAGCCISLRDFLSHGAGTSSA